MERVGKMKNPKSLAAITMFAVSTTDCTTGIQTSDRYSGRIFNGAPNRVNIKIAEELTDPANVPGIYR